jgi:microcompartment protein CcmK/EutM
MFLGKVIGEVWASRKAPDLVGKRLLVIEPVDDADAPEQGYVKPVVAADPLGADQGEYVVVAFGKAARVACGGDGDLAFEAAVVGIVDQGEVQGRAWFDGYKRAPGTARLQPGSSLSAKDARLEPGGPRGT